VKAAKTRKNTVSKLIIDDWDHAIEIIKTDVVRKTDEVTTDARSEEFNNRKHSVDDDIPQQAHSHFQLQEHLRQVQEDCRGGAHGQSEYEELDLEQQEASATALTSPLYTKNELMRKTAKKTQVETSDKVIIAANTEDLEIENYNKFKNQVAKTGANYQPR
jgi:hypothetical protein